MRQFRVLVSIDSQSGHENLRTPVFQLNGRMGRKTVPFPVILRSASYSIYSLVGTMTNYLPNVIYHHL